jgi:hypothetical protein
MVDKPGVYTMPAAEYHADPCPKASLSSSIARTMISRSALHAWSEHPRLNPEFQPKERKEFDLGSAAHALLLEGDDRMQVIVANDYRTKIAQEERDAARAAGKFPILQGQYASVHCMRAVALKAIAECPDLNGLTLADGAAEQTFVWQEGGVWCRARPDFMFKGRRLFLDYKTTNASAHPDAWVRTLAGMEGEVQPSFYRRGNAATGGPEDAKFIFLVQETQPPYACSLVGLPPAFVALGDEKVAEAIATWRTCMSSGQWPAYPSRVCWVDPPTYHVNRWMERGGDQAHGIPYDIEKFWGEGKESFA